jgi:hypothetical protein
VIPEARRTRPSMALRLIKFAHTVAWAIFVAVIFAIPLASLREEHTLALELCAVVGAEVTVLIITSWRCPLTYLAARYTRERQANFDIYLPEWLARYNKEIFGTFYVVFLVLAVVRWALAPG